ncbi:MAG TPA: serine/threonine-protein kinase, partial [bacterium]|nr:serine/threonine-protein kinase [bacterium]
MEGDQKLLERARALDRAGDTDEAVELLSNAGYIEEAARVLAGRVRYLDAAKLLVTQLGEITAGGRLAPRAHTLARLAAAYFQKAGEVQRAADLLVGVGERAKAIELLERAGKAEAALALRKTAAAEARPSSRAPGAKPGAPATGSAGPTPAAPSAPAAGSAAANASAAQAQHLEEKGDLEGAMKIYFSLKRFADAGRLARKLGRNNDAGNFYFAAQLFYEAAGCYFAAGDRVRALESLARVPREHPQYRAAAVGAARLASETGALGFRVETFLFPFTSSAPEDASEVEAFYLLARVYEKNDLPAPAMELYRKVVTHAPGFRDAQARLAALDTVGERKDLERIMDEEAAFRGRPTKRKAVEAEGAGAAAAAPGAPRKKGFPFKKSDTGTASALAPAAPPPPADRRPTLESNAGTGGVQPVAQPTDAGVNVGSVVAGRYRIDAPIGAGGMAVVFRATDLDLEESVALKIFTDVAEEKNASRIKHELRISRQLTHPNIIRIYDLGVDRGHRYITMELLVGEDLWQYSQKHVLSVGQKLELLEQACAGLEEAHQRGVVHRDIKPEN